MTVEVGILCKGGVVIAADSAATFGSPNLKIMEQPTRKISIVANKVIVAGTGAVGLCQRLHAIIENLFANPGFDVVSPLEKGKLIARAAIQDFASTHAPFQGQFAALVAFAHEGVPCLIEFCIPDFQPELKRPDEIWYVSVGSGELIADPMLAWMREVFWTDGPPVLQSGIFAASWVMDHVVKINAGGVNGPIDIAVLEFKDGEFRARMLTPDELDEHKGNVQAAREHMRRFEEILLGKGGNVPDVPKLN